MPIPGAFFPTKPVSILSAPERTELHDGSRVYICDGEVSILSAPERTEQLFLLTQGINIPIVSILSAPERTEQLRRFGSANKGT